MAIDYERLTPIEVAERKRRRIFWAVLALLLIAVLVWRTFFTEWVVAQDDPLDHFKYGSIGSEGASGLPRKVFDAIPELYADHMQGQGWQYFGLVQEEGAALPVGFSRRKVDGIERVWLNCSVCHMGTYTLPGEEEVQFIPGAPSNQLRLQELIRFFIDVGRDPGLNADALLAVMDDTNFIERPIYRYIAVPAVKEGLLDLGRQLSFVERQHDWGPGRVDTFNPYKAIQFNFPMGPDSIDEVALNGAADYPAIWMQAPREGMQLHWDGNNDSVDERNLSAALGAGVTPVTADHAAIERVRDWLLELPSPRWPLDIDADLAAEGAPVYAEYCAECHGGAGATGYDYDRGRYQKLGTVEPLSEIGTDVGRWASYDADFAAAQNMLYAGTDYAFRHFRKTNGYANQPLDGIWARSPYLHNGSVPTLRDLLEPAEMRPKVWWRGHLEIDPLRVGYRSDEAEGLFRYDTALPGNGNGGHSYGTELSAPEKDALVEYMKTL